VRSERCIVVIIDNRRQPIVFPTAPASHAGPFPSSTETVFRFFCAGERLAVAQAIRIQLPRGINQSLTKIADL
jgi:hypothetical protein